MARKIGDKGINSANLGDKRKKKAVKLDKYDRMILHELDKNCRLPLSKLAKKVRRSRQAVEYRINNMVDSGLITSFAVAINPSKMGYRLYKIYLQLKNIEKDRDRLMNFLYNAGNVYWMGECDGEWDLIFAVSALDEKEFFDFKNELFSKFGSVIIDHYGDMLVDVRQYVKMYFTGEKDKPVMFAGAVEDNKIEKTDARILAALLKDARMHVTELAKHAKTTPAIVRSRMKKMEKLGIIIQYRIGVDLEKIGMELFKAIIHTDKYSEDEEKKFIAFVSSLPNVQYIIRNMWQTELEFAVSGYKEYRHIISALRKNFPSLIRNVESVIMKTDDWTPGYRNLIAGNR